MSVLKLGTEGLSDAETRLVKTLLKLMAVESDFRWIYAAEGPTDGLLIDATSASPGSNCTAILIKLVDKGQSLCDNTFQRPINSPALKEWLKMIESQCQAAPRMALESACQGSSSEPREAYRLTRWPPHMIMREDRTRARLATLMTRKAMDVTQLAQVSGVPLKECASFVTVLKALGLVAVTHAPLTQTLSTPDNRLDNALAEKDLKNDPPRGFGFISAIRRKLGL